MVALSLVSLCIFIFGAYAYGVTTVLAFRQTPVWGRGDGADTARRPMLDPVLLTLCIVCTVWFVLHALSEFRVLTGRVRWQGLPDIMGLVLSYAFPPLIMHNVLHGTPAECRDSAWRRRWAWPVWTMYALSFATGAFVFGVVMFDLPHPRPFGAYAGVSVGLLFTICSVYCVGLMIRRRASSSAAETQSADQRGLHRTMIGLFLAMIPLFFALTFLQDRRLLVEALDRVARALPIFFLVTSIYFENRFEFYDLIVKRATMLLASLLAIGVFFAASLSTLERLPTGIARPWLFAVGMLPMAMVLPWLHRTVGRWLDRMWFGREFTPVEAVKHVLSGMQPATDERALVEATEARLSDMFHTRVHILLDNAPAPEGSVVETVDTGPSTSDRARLRVAVVRPPGSRRLLSEDVSLLRSLAGVFGYMLENVRLQRRRQEQDLIAQELRLQTSRSELKALRAQINPHFLFNALNAIASLIHTDPTRADAAVEQLAEVFRYTLRRSEQEWAPLDQELAFARAYLDVEQARFGKRLSFSVDAAPETAGAQVPAMLLHTIVENAVKHGISQMRGPGRIEIRAAAQDDVLLLEVTDTGPGLGQSGAHRTGESFGLRSVRDRLRGHFAERAALDRVRDELRGLTVVRVRMPLVSEITREESLAKEPV
jgi:signal transduction histidine kinase